MNRQRWLVLIVFAILALIPPTSAVTTFNYMNGFYNVTIFNGTAGTASFTVPADVTTGIDYLVVAGGGGGGTFIGGGGAAGGLLNGTTTALSIGTTYTITVGAGGGAGAPACPRRLFFVPAWRATVLEFEPDPGANAWQRRARPRTAGPPARPRS